MFRVIVVGAGIAGLTASHCLQKAGIDHVVLERRTEVDPPEGASYAIYPHGARILHQIGCLEVAIAACQPCLRYYSRRPDGGLLFDNGFFDHIERNHGHHILLLERRRLLRLLYDCLPDKTPIRTGARAVSMTQTDYGVRVVLVDGSVEKGDMVIGCDGVHSQVKEWMWQHINLTSPRSVTDAERELIQTHWKCLVGVGPPELGLGERDMTSTSDHRFSFLTLTQPDQSFWFVFCKLDSPIAWPERVQYTEQDAEELAALLAHHPVSATVRFGQLWRRRRRGALIPIQEGILRRWFAGRVVLAGDAAHKMTPNIGLGGNSAMASVVALCNHLVRALQEQQCRRVSDVGKPDGAALERCFRQYQKGQRSRLWKIVQLSRIITRVQAWDSVATRWLGRWVLPALPDKALAQAVSLTIRDAPKLDYVSVDKFPSGLVNWKDSDGESEVQRPFWAMTSGLGIAMTLVAVGLYYILFK